MIGLIDILYVIIISVSKEPNQKSGQCTVGQKKQNTPINFNTNYRKEMKLVPIIMDYCLLQFKILLKGPSTWEIFT